MVDLDVGDMLSKVNQAGKDLAPVTGAVGFIYGVVGKFKSSGNNPNTSYPFNTQGVSDLIAQIAGKQTAASLGLPTGSADKVFNLGAVVNKGTGIAIVLALAKDIMPNKYIRLAYNVGFPIAAGYGIGRIFDDQTGANVGNAPSPGRANPNLAPLQGSNWTSKR